MQGGTGSPLLLIHGYPQNHVIWHKVAPRLAQQFTLVIPDLRGYGDSSKPPTDAEHLPYSKRAMALDMVEVMSALGFERFDVVGHDRGARVTYRLALDHPARVRRAAVLDIIPTLEQFERVDRYRRARDLSLVFSRAARAVSRDSDRQGPGLFPRAFAAELARHAERSAPEALEAYRKAFRDPEVIHGSCEDYRAGITCDCKFDEADRAAGRKLAMPLLALWGARGRRGASLLEIWKSWANRRARRGSRLRAFHSGRSARSVDRAIACVLRRISATRHSAHAPFVS